MTYGTDPHLLHRTDAIDTSIDAAYAVDTTELERLVHSTIKKAGPFGMIADDVLAAHPSYPYSSITARFSALIRKGLVERTGEKRRGRSGRNQRVMVAVDA